MQFDETQALKFFKFIYDRHWVWRNRFVLKLPREKWTKDPILKKYKFTNVYRELDRGTQYYLDEVVKPILGDSKSPTEAQKQEIVFRTYIYRFINKIETFQECGMPSKEDDLDEWAKKLRARSARGEAIFSGAYRTICACPTGTNKIDVLVEVLKDLREAVWNDQFFYYLTDEKTNKDDGGEGCWNCIQCIDHVGPFLGYEIYSDLIYSQTISFTENEFVNIGPGAEPSIKILFPGVEKYQYQACVAFLAAIQEQMFYKVFKEYNVHDWFPYYEGKLLSWRNIEHSLCEWRKYLSAADCGVRPTFNPIS